MKLIFISAAAVLCLSLLGSCSKPPPLARTFQMGEKAQVGPLYYTVLGAEWRTEIGADIERRVAKDRFLIVHLTIFNSGSGDAGAPLTQLVDAQGKEHGELQDVKGLPQWMGLMRRISPTSTEEGRLVFDVPLGIYKLKVSDGGIEIEKTAIIEIPLELNGIAPPSHGSIPQSK